MSEPIYAGDEWKVSAAGANVYQPQIEHLENGDRVIAYQQGLAIQYVIVSPDGSEILRASIGGEEGSPAAGARLLAQSDGGFLLAWQQGASYGLQKFDSSGTAIGETISVDRFNFFPGTLLDLGAGSFAYVTENTDGIGWTLHRRDAAGETIGEPVAVSSSVGVEAMHVLPSGDFLLVERRQVAIGEFVRELFVVDGEGNRGSAMALTGDVIELEKLDDGRFAVLSTGDGKMWLQFVDGAGSLLGEATAIMDPLSYNGTVKLVPMEDGAFAVITDGPAVPFDTSNMSDVYGQLFDADGIATTGQFRINRVTDNSQSFVDASYADGRLSVVWNDFRNGAFTVNAIYVQDIALASDGDDTSPTAIAVSTLTVNENTAAGSVVATLVTTDPSLGETFTYDLPEGSQWFEIAGDTLVVKAGVTLDFETAASLTEAVTIRSTDSDDNSHTQTFTFTLADVAEALMGTPKNDKLNGTASNDTIYGLEGNDTINGKAGNDVIHGGAGNDTYVITSVAGTMTLIELDGEGRDTVRSATSHTLAANIENLVLTGKADASANGNALANTITGNRGDNLIFGGAGGDTLKGGAGGDAFVFVDATDSTVKARGRDLIVDFSRKQGDAIDLAGLDAKEGGTDNDAFTFIGTRAFGDKEGQLRYEKLGKDTLVSGDSDGDGRADFAIELSGFIKLKADDFLL
jgi:hypothetical protein